jgi:hypothetical protein
MISALIGAGVRLAGLLEAENRALAALDLAAAAALAEPKREAVEAFAAAEATARRAGVRAGEAEREVVRSLSERLGALAAANRRMLERALAAQDALVRVLSEAAQPVDGRYVATGAPRPLRHAAPAVTLAAQL